MKHKLPVRSCLGVLLIIAGFWIPLAEIRPNRVQKGVAFTFADVAGQRLTLFLLAFLLTIGLWWLQSRQKRSFALRAITCSAMMIPSAAVYLACRSQETQQLIQTLGMDPESLRISLKAGFWILLSGVTLLLGAGIDQNQQTKNIKISLMLMLLIAVILSSRLIELSLVKEFLNVQAMWLNELIRHTWLSIGSVAVGIIPGMIIGYKSFKTPKLKSWLMGFVNGVQVIPTVSLLGLLMIPLSYAAAQWTVLREVGISGVGAAPAFIALLLYSLLPISLNTLAGLNQIETSVQESAIAMGLSHRQLLWRVQLPLAVPVILSGIRTALTQSVGNTILAGLIGGGGMGSLIFLGLSQSASDLVILGTIPVVALAFLIEMIFLPMEQMTLKKMGVSHDRA